MLADCAFLLKKDDEAIVIYNELLSIDLPKDIRKIMEYNLRRVRELYQS